MKNPPKINWNDPLDQRFRVSNEPPVNPVAVSRPPAPRPTAGAGPNGRRYNANGDEYVNAELVPDDRPPYQRYPTPRKAPFVSPNPNIHPNPNPVGWVWCGELNEWITEEESRKNVAAMFIIVGVGFGVVCMMLMIGLLMQFH